MLDPFSGSGSTGIAALQLGCTYVGFEIDPEQVTESQRRLADAAMQHQIDVDSPSDAVKPQQGTAKNCRLDL